MTTGVLIRGLGLITQALAVTPPVKDGAKPPLASTVLAETPPPGDIDATDTKGSFSRTAGAIGAVGMAAVSIELGYWVLYALFFDPQQLDKLKDTGLYFLAGSALFFPYAVNQLSKIFKT